MKTKRYIAYYRVSTRKQGESGLGLEAQQVDVLAFVARQSGEVLASYVEIDTGKNSERPELAKAIAHAAMANAILVVAKLDRLSRSVALISRVMASETPFVCTDRPDADTFRLHIEAAIAEEEARKISERTTKALAALKARGVKLGSAREGAWTGKEHLRGFKKATERSAAVRRRRTDVQYAHVTALVQDLRGQGLTLADVAERLNADGHCTGGGQAFTEAAVWRLCKRHAPECLGRVQTWQTAELEVK
jgi:DNA invertase Pin-like site-specific DNA recombinase